MGSYFYQISLIYTHKMLNAIFVLERLSQFRRNSE